MKYCVCGTKVPDSEWKCPRCQHVFHSVNSPTTANTKTCPECGNATAFQEGCEICFVCGWSACDNI